VRSSNLESRICGVVSESSSISVVALVNADSWPRRHVVLGAVLVGNGAARSGHWFWRHLPVIRAILLVFFFFVVVVASKFVDHRLLFFFDNHRLHRALHLLQVAPVHLIFNKFLFILPLDNNFKQGHSNSNKT